MRDSSGLHMIIVQVLFMAFFDQIRLNMSVLLYLCPRCNALRD